MFSILLQDSDMRWAQNLAVIYLQLKFMTYMNIYIHLKWKAELHKHFSSIFLLYVLILPSVEIIICLVIQPREKEKKISSYTSGENVYN